MHRAFLRVFFLIVFCLHSISFAEDKKTPKAGDGYTINFTNVSALEYVRFISKITNLNLIFNEEDLNFSVTVVSEDPISKENIISTLTQVLRIHGLELLEEGNNLIIHKNPEVKQIANLVFNDKEMDPRFPLTTRVFKIRNGKAASISAIVQPMLSEQAMVETALESNQLILTDVTTNVEKVALLIENLDSPNSSFSIETFHAKNNAPELLITLANEIMAPMSMGNPFILVTQPKTGLIFIVSTPGLVEKAISVLGSLDSSSKNGKQDLSPENVFIYRVEHRSLSEIQRSLKEIAKNLEKNGYAERGLIETLDSASVVKESNSLLLTGDPTILAKAREMISILDTPTPEMQKEMGESFFVYIPINRSPDATLKGIHEVIHNLSQSNMGDQDLINTLTSARVVQSTQSIIFTGDPATFAKVRELLSSIDLPGASEFHGKTTFYIYKLEKVPPEQLRSSLEHMAKNLEKSGVKDQSLIETLESAKYLTDSNSFLFTGPQASLNQLKEILPTFDKDFPSQKISNQFFIYKPKYLKGNEIYKALKDYAKNLEDSHLRDAGLLRSIDSMKWVKSTNSLMFTGDPESLQKVEGLISTIDGPAESPGHQQAFFVYQLQYAGKQQVHDYLKQVAKTLKNEGLPEEDLIDAIDSMKWIEESHSYMFTGTQNSLDRIKVILKDFDVPVEKGFAKAQPTFVLYQLKNIDQEMAENFLKQIAQNLNKSNEEQKNLYSAINSMKWIAQSNSYMFSGTQDSLNEIQSLLTAYDIPGQKGFQKSFLTYQLKNASRARFESYFKHLAKNLQKNDQDPDLVKTIETMKWIPGSKSFLFSGSESSLQKLSGMINDYDTPAERDGGESYYLYKLKYVKGDAIEEDLEKFAKNMKEAGLADSQVVLVIDNIKWVKQTNSLLLTGDNQAVEEVRLLIDQYDTQERPEKLHSDFFMYKPVYTSPENLEQALLDIAENLKDGGLVDEGLISAIKSVKYSSQTHALIFTGSPQSLQKIAGLIKEIDQESAQEVSIQRLGKTTFLLYKLKYASGPQIMKSIRGVEADLKKGGTEEKAFLNVLNSMKYIRETNSLLFTGHEEALERTRSLVEKFDVPALGDRTVAGASDFLIYKPQHIPGPQLEELMIEFVDHLKTTGLTDPELYSTIHSVKFVAKTNSLIFTGNETTLGKVGELLKTFDIPGGGMPIAESSIQEIDNASFLVYKLQYHKGTEIQAALRSIGNDLLKTKTTVNHNLLDAIQSIQWLQVTNSLLCTGDQETLTRLKELIKNLDVPLKQVFIEVLAIETSLSNFMEFGLNWGAKAKYKDRFAASTSNFSQNATDTSTGISTFSDAISNTNATTAPSTTGIPMQTGFDFGVIGDIIFHKGKSFLSLGSLLNALQNDSETSILLTPKIVAQDSKTSTLFVGQNIPFIGSFVQNTTSNTVSTSNVEYRDIGVNMTITPVLGNSDIITLDINIENSVVPTDATGQTTNVSVGNVQAITTNKTTMQTTVHVPNESFLVLSGMLDITKRRAKQGIPCLGGLPIIGAAFSLLEKTDTRNNIVIFIRPHIINSYEDIKQITQEQEDLFRSEAGSPDLEVRVDEGMELIKSEDDD